jgi:hypothetical protein
MDLMVDIESLQFTRFRIKLVQILIKTKLSNPVSKVIGVRPTETLLWVQKGLTTMRQISTQFKE